MKVKALCNRGYVRDITVCGRRHGTASMFKELLCNQSQKKESKDSGRSFFRPTTAKKEEMSVGLVLKLGSVVAILCH